MPFRCIFQCSSCAVLSRGMQASTTENRRKAEPFYWLSGAKPKTSSEIVNEARDALRTVKTPRPFTPTDELRKLFGSQSSRCPQNRPPSVFRYCCFRFFQISFSSKRFDSVIMLPVIIFPMLICIPNHILCLLLMIFTVGVNLHVQEVRLD